MPIRISGETDCEGIYHDGFAMPNASGGLMIWLHQTISRRSRICPREDQVCFSLSREQFIEAAEQLGFAITSKEDH
jgi:hypothetical protein